MDIDGNEYYFLFYSLLLAMSELHICPGVVATAGQGSPPPLFLGVAIGL